MSTRIRPRKVIAAALALTAWMSVACGRDEMRTETIATDDGAQQVSEGAPVTITGCLQESSGDLVLTAAGASGTPGAVGTTGDASGTSPATDQMAAARRSYLLEGDESALRAHVGSEVRVIGTLEERSDMQPGADRTDLDTGDLAAIDVQSVDTVAAICSEGK